MNDDLVASHEAIFDMVHSGEPDQSAAWARCVTGVSRDLGSLLESLREYTVRISAVWSDGAGSVRLTADLNTVIEYLQVVSDGLSGQPASCADITVQAAADLAAAQPSSVMPPPLSRSPAGLSTEYRPIHGWWLDPDVFDLPTGHLNHQLAASQAAWFRAGETATMLDDKYRTALARLTPLPEPPPMVQLAATSGAAVAAPPVTGAAAAVRGGWAADSDHWGGSTGSGWPTDAGGSVDASRSGWARSCPAGDPEGGGVRWPANPVVTAAMLSGGGAVHRVSRPRIDVAVRHGGPPGGSFEHGSFEPGSFEPGSVKAGSVESGSTGHQVGTTTAGSARFDSSTGAAVSGAGVTVSGAGVSDAGAGVSDAGSVPLVRGGQIGPAGLPLPAPSGVGIGSAGAAGFGMGAEHAYRVTWLVEDRVLYGRGPSVQPLVQATPEAT